MKNNNYMRREIQRLLKQNVYIELEVTSNTFCFCQMKSDKLDFEEKWEHHGEVKYLDLDICRHFKGFFDRKWLIITDFHVYKRGLDVEDEDIVAQMSLEDIYNYLNIKEYEFVDGYPIVNDLEYYNNLLLSASNDEFLSKFNQLNKIDKNILFTIAIKLYKENVFNDLRKIKVLEDHFNRQDFFNMDLS